MRLVACTALVAVAILPLALGFTSAPMALRAGSARACVSRPASARRANLGLRMAEDAPEAVAGVSEESDQEQRSLSKTRTNKRPRSDNKNKKPLSDFTVGEMVTGKVVSIMPYGAFVDVGTTTDGLVHVSQIADDFVSDIESVVKVGDEVSVRIMTVDEGANKISLSMRSENAKPSGGRQGGGQQRGGGGGKSDVPEQFRNFDDKEFIAGKVASVMEYGCFVSIAEGVDALVHVSEISEERNVDPSKMFKVGQDVKVRIISYDKSKRRLSLSMKEWTEPVAKDETDDIKSYVDPVPETQKTAFQMAWEAAQKQKTAA